MYKTSINCLRKIKIDILSINKKVVLNNSTLRKQNGTLEVKNLAVILFIIRFERYY